LIVLQYRARDKPRYRLGHGKELCRFSIDKSLTLVLGLVLMYIVIGITASVTYVLLLKRENARRDRGERNEIIENQPETHDTGNEKNGRYATVEEAKREKGDKWSGYRYMI
jgi:hypothetical protein